MGLFQWPRVKSPLSTWQQIWEMRRLLRQKVPFLVAFAFTRTTGLKTLRKSLTWGICSFMDHYSKPNMVLSHSCYYGPENVDLVFHPDGKVEKFGYTHIQPHYGGLRSWETDFSDDEQDREMI